jgi:hypothetical protein
MKLAEQIVTAYDNSDWQSVKILQVAIEFISQSSSFEDLEYQGMGTRQRLFLQTLVKNRAKGKEKEIVESGVKDLIRKIRQEKTVNTSNIEEIMNKGDDFEAHKQFGFTKVNYDGYHGKEVDKIRFGQKPNFVTLTICEDPNGRFYYGTALEMKNSGSYNGCWLKSRSFATKEEIYRQFYLEVGRGKSFFAEAEPAYKKIMKEIATKLSIDTADIDFVNQRTELLEQIKDDLNQFKIDGHEQRARISRYFVEMEVHKVGKWIAQPGENSVLAPGEQEKYENEFITFASKFDWFDKVDLFFYEHGAYYYGSEPPDDEDNSFELKIQLKDDLDLSKNDLQ